MDEGRLLGGVGKNRVVVYEHFLLPFLFLSSLSLSLLPFFFFLPLPTLSTFPSSLHLVLVYLERGKFFRKKGERILASIARLSGYG